MEISEHTRGLFLGMARWAKFLAIIGFISVGLIAIVGFGVMFIPSDAAEMAAERNMIFSAGSVVAGLILLVFAVVYFFPAFFLLRFASRVKQGLMNTDQTTFENSIASLKNMFTYMGILVIVMLSLYGIVILAAIASAASRS